MIDSTAVTLVNIESIAQRFSIDTSGCWLWTGYINKNGYSQFSIGRSTDHIHRLLYRLVGNLIPEGLELDHLCRVRHCINPKHLEPVTRKENLHRGNMKGWYMTKSHCLRGHEFTEENTYTWKDHRRTSGIYRTCKACYKAYNKRRNSNA